MERIGEKAYLVLENGRVFQGRRFGAPGELMAEVVFTTGMGGYLETITDPSYWGQIVVQTFPLIGNYGVIPADFESGVVGPRDISLKLGAKLLLTSVQRAALTPFLKIGDFAPWRA